MNLLYEAMSQFRIEKYLTCSTTVDIQKLTDISNSEVNDEITIIKVDEIESVLLQSRDWVTRIRESFDKFVEESLKESEQFKYWSIFLDELYPVLCDLTVSHRNGNVQLSAVERAIKLFFAFDRTNYSRWAPLYLQDCLKLEQKFPLIYEEFMERGSFVPMDQALEKEYNTVAKGKGGVIGFLKQKGTVTKWNLIKHEKSVESIKKCTASHEDRFDISLTKNITNIATGDICCRILK